jgi:hypothetical protein
MLSSVDPRRVLLAMLFAPPADSGSDAVPSMVLEELDEAALEEADWGPFKAGMSRKEVMAIIQAQSGQAPDVHTLPGLKWDTIFFQDKMLTIESGTLLRVHRA